MPATVLVNKLTAVHKSSDGTVTFMPDVCLTPQPSGPPLPIPYPNTAMSSDADGCSRTVTYDGNPVMLQGSTFKRSTGNEAGSAGGLVSKVTCGAAEFANYSFDVTIEGKQVPRQTDIMLGNKGTAFNTAPAPEVQPPSVVSSASSDTADPQPEKLKIVLVDGAGKPRAKVRYALERPDGSKTEGTTDDQGRITLDDTRLGLGRIVFLDSPGKTMAARASS